MDGTLDIQFRKNKLEKAYRNTKDGVRQLGADIHRKYVQRIDLICEARNIDELAMLPGLHWHSLKGDRWPVCGDLDRKFQVDINCR